MRSLLCGAIPQMAEGPPGTIVAPSGAVYKPEECGMDGNGDGWCAGEAVPAEFFIEKEKVKKKKKWAKSPKKKAGGGGRIPAIKWGNRPSVNLKSGKAMAQSQGPKKPRLITGRPDQSEDEQSNSGAMWIALILFLVLLPAGWFGYKTFLKEDKKDDEDEDDEHNQTQTEKKTASASEVKVVT